MLLSQCDLKLDMRLYVTSKSDFFSRAIFFNETKYMLTRSRSMKPELFCKSYTSAA